MSPLPRKSVYIATLQPMSSCNSGGVLVCQLTMYTTNVIADGVLPGVLFARVKEISFKRHASYMKLACVKGS